MVNLNFQELIGGWEIIGEIQYRTQQGKQRSAEKIEKSCRKCGKNSEDDCRRQDRVREIRVTRMSFVPYSFFHNFPPLQRNLGTHLSSKWKTAFFVLFFRRWIHNQIKSSRTIRSEDIQFFITACFDHLKDGKCIVRKIRILIWEQSILEKKEKA